MLLDWDSIGIWADSNECASIDKTFKEFVKKYTGLADMDIRIGKFFDGIWFNNDAMKMQLLHKPVVEAMVK